eukprot:TRINITY_DN1169_c0_g1_i1.p1 TRINITY_DN1169_c0_g1~~TRINITY_DN1169_c0_g1_i1.p1  ORF type:complete len:446 (+),score=124.93 TRINITY_DN1169_c0_g1_i1:90-1427(+)
MLANIKNTISGATTTESAPVVQYDLPKTHRSLLLKQFIKDYNDLDADQIQSHFEVKEVPLPVLKRDELLVRIERSPINPSDISTLKGTYGSTKSRALPFSPGFEGSGTIVAAGGGLVAWAAGLSVGKRVAFYSNTAGAWSEYVAVKPTTCTLLADGLDFDSSASAFVNPLTVISFLEIAKSLRQTTIVHTAGASSLGKMLIRLGKKEGISVIAVVRRAEQVQPLMELGAIHVVNTSDEEWQEDLKEQCAKYRSALAFDAVAGDLTGQILHIMPKGTVIKVYGGMSEALCTVSPGDLIFANKKVEGFWLTDYIKSKGLVGLALWQRKQKALLGGELKTDVREVVDIEKFGYALRTYADNMSAGKILITAKSTDEGSSTQAAGSAVTEGEEENTQVVEEEKGKEIVEEKEKEIVEPEGEKVQEEEPTGTSEEVTDNTEPQNKEEEST